MSNVDRFDEIFSQIGNFGPYQIYLYTILACGATFPAGMASVGSVFLQGETDFTCNVENSTDLPQDYNKKCEVYTTDSCHEFENGTKVPCKNGYEFAEHQPSSHLQ